MKILLVSDEESKYIWDHFDKERFSDIDLIISCGDLKSSYLSYLVTMINAPLYYVPGNHDRNYEYKPPEGCTNIDGKLVTYKGIRILGLGGSMKYSDNLYQYTEKEMKRKINKLRLKLLFTNGFDILVTHTPAKGLGDGTDLCHTGFESYKYIYNKYKPKFHFHGHQHLNYSIQRRFLKYKSTIIVNAFNYYIIDYKNDWEI